MNRSNPALRTHRDEADVVIPVGAIAEVESFRQTVGELIRSAEGNS